MEIAREGKIKGFAVQGIGISAPGAIDPRTGRVLGRTGALNLPAWGDFSLQGEMAARTGLAVRALNDAKAMALGALARIAQDVVEYKPADAEGDWIETLLGEEGRSLRDFIELDPGTGLGGAYVSKGRIWFGPDPGRPDPEVGEIWKLTPDPARPELRWEDMVSGRATWQRIEKRCEEALGQNAGPLLSKAKGRIQHLLGIAPAEIQKIIDEELASTGADLALGMRYLMTHEQARLKAPRITTFMIGGGPVSGKTPASREVRSLLHRSITRQVPAIRLLFTTLGAKAGLYGSASIINSPA
jgi:predicted NBD/HSP70 family sugar kinase